MKNTFTNELDKRSKILLGVLNVLAALTSIALTVTLVTHLAR